MYANTAPAYTTTLNRGYRHKNMEKFLRKILIKLAALFTTEEIRILDATIHERYSKGDSFYPEHPHYAYWERQSHSWDWNAPPVRPSKGEIEIYGDFLKRKDRKSRILVLGSTPELRDLVSATDAKIYVADFSYRMPAAMLRFTRNVDPLKEKWIKDNWLELPFPPKFFDVILGDVVLHQVTPNLELTFLEKIRSLLENDGFFITRLFFLDETFLQKDLYDITKQILTGPFSYTQKATLLRLQPVWLFADLTKRKFNRRLSAQKFSEMMKEEKLSNPILKEVCDILITDKDSYRDWSPPREEEMIHILSSSFDIIERGKADDYPYAEYFPIFLLTPK